MCKKVKTNEMRGLRERGRNERKIRKGRKRRDVWVQPVKKNWSLPPAPHPPAGGDRGRGGGKGVGGGRRGEGGGSLHWATLFRDD